jgi:hypothetical protein
VLQTGASATVERAIAESGKDALDLARGRTIDGCHVHA